jgi:hypothetical protein
VNGQCRVGQEWWRILNQPAAAQQVGKHPGVGVKEPLPQHRRDDGWDGPGNYHHGPQNTPQPAVNRKGGDGHAQTQAQLQHHRNDRKIEGEKEGITKGFALEYGRVVAQSDEGFIEPIHSPV